MALNLAALRGLVLTSNFSTHGIPVTVTAPDEAPISTRGIWVTPVTDEFGAGVTRAEAKRVIALRRDQVAQVPRGTLIEAPDMAGGVSRTWRVERPDRIEVEHVRVVVVPAE